MKITNSQPSGAAGVMAGSVPGSGVTITPTAPLTGTDLETVIDQLLVLIDAAGVGDFLTVINGGGGTVQAHGSMGSTETIDLANGNRHWGTLNANCTFTFTVTADTADRQFILELIEDGTGGWSPTWPASVTWLGGIAPTHTTTAGTTTFYLFFTRNGGTTWIGGQLGAAPPFAVPAIVLGTAAAAGVATTTIRSDATIVAFDATLPAAVGTAAVGIATVAARRDHVHGGASTHWEPVIFDNAGTPEIVYFQDSGGVWDIVMHEVSN